MSAPAASKIKPRERDAVLQSLQAGLVPKIGLHLIQVGRKLEVSAMLQDIERIVEQHFVSSSAGLAAARASFSHSPGILHCKSVWWCCRQT
jgi:P-loop Domain of unknown function (DUF2791)